ncbi:phage minor tail protein L [Xenorhabdus sp. 12]|uniref:Phage minor tail protein L n=1 Tax=Xenorhabdus santafensis TaxID=2582833 RepID=A0ABU4S738_9GAMM|nr:phage minor tail protein L [Xenorhabdus sp. 12]MDX7986703.1 phage minor tail protein L [Xenorhabdus sp. 12]
MLTADVQKLDAGNTVRLYEIDGTKFGAEVLRFHAYGMPVTEEEIEAAEKAGSQPRPKSLWWQGDEYKPWPVQIEGLEMSTDGQAARPRLSVSNIEGTVTALCLQFEDMVQAKVIIHDTFAHYLDARNFTEGNPTADPQQERKSLFYINRKTAETDKTVVFELASPASLDGLMIPTRQIHGVCTWRARGWYRTGKGCDYAGTKYIDSNGNPTDDPSKDRCPGTVTACKYLHGEDEPLPFGGFPASSLIRRS